MYVYIESETGLWTVGFYMNGKFVPESDFDDIEGARRMVNYLNGGTVVIIHKESVGSVQKVKRSFSEGNFKGN